MTHVSALLQGIDRHTARRIAIAIVVAAVVATAGCSGVLPGSDDGSDVDPIEFVPENQDVLVHVDMAIVEDQTTRDLLEATGDDVGDDPEDPFEEFEEETGLDPRGVHEVLVFGQTSGTGLAGAGAQEEFGIVFTSDWSEDELVSAIEEDEDVDLRATTYEGQEVLYEPADDQAFGEPVYLGVLGDGAFVVGSEASVTGSLDVAYGGASPVSGELLDAYESAPDGLITFAMVVPEDQLGGGAGGMGASAADDVEAINGVYTTEGDRVIVEVQLLTGSEQSATELQQMLQGFLTFYGQNPEMSELVQQIEITQDGSTVRITFEASVDEIADLAESA